MHKITRSPSPSVKSKWLYKFPFNRQHGPNDLTGWQTSLTILPASHLPGQTIMLLRSKRVKELSR